MTGVLQILQNNKLEKEGFRGSCKSSEILEPSKQLLSFVLIDIAIIRAASFTCVTRAVTPPPQGCFEDE